MRKLWALPLLLLLSGMAMGQTSPNPITRYCQLTATGYCPGTAGVITLNQGIDTHNVYIVPIGTPGSISVSIQGSVIGDFTDVVTCGSASTTTTPNLLSCSGIYSAVRVKVTTLTGFTSVNLFYVGTSTVGHNGGSGGGTPGGSDTQVQYNNSGSFGGASGLIISGGNATVPSGKTFTIDNGGTLTCAAGSTCPSSGGLTYVTTLPGSASEGQQFWAYGPGVIPNGLYPYHGGKWLGQQFLGATIQASSLPSVGQIGYSDIPVTPGATTNLIQVSSNLELTTLSFPALVDLSATSNSAEILIDGNILLQTVTFPQLTNMSGQADINIGTSSGNPDMTVVSFPALTDVTGSPNDVIGISDNSGGSVTEIDFPVLANLSGPGVELHIYSCLCNTVDFSSLADVSGSGSYVNISNAANLTSVSFPALVNISGPGAYVQVVQSPLFSSVSLPVLVHLSGGSGASLGFNNDALPTSQINSLLVKMAATGDSNGTIYLNGQTPAAPPTGNGILAIQALLANSWTVFTDPTGAPFNITAVNQGTKTFTVAGDQTPYMPATGTATVSGSTGNDGTYTVVSSTFTGGNTNIVVSQIILSPVADGTIGEY